MKLIEYLLFLIIGIIIFLILNSKETFNVGVPWIILDGHNTGRYPSFNDDATLYSSFNDAVAEVPLDPSVQVEKTIYHVVYDVETNSYKPDLEGCYSPHNKISGKTSFETLQEFQNQENEETKPLVPRDNLLFSIVSRLHKDSLEVNGVDEPLIYNYGDTITYSCDNTKTKSALRDHNLVCKRRKKFVLLAHGMVDTSENTELIERIDKMEKQLKKGKINEEYMVKVKQQGIIVKTTVPPLFQLILYIPNTQECVTYPQYQIPLLYESFFSQNLELTDPSIMLSNIAINGKIKVENRKKYMQILDDVQYVFRPIHELVYSEMKTMNSGTLYVSMEYNPSAQEPILDYHTNSEYYNDVHIYCESVASTNRNPDAVSSIFYSFSTINPDFFKNEINRLFIRTSYYNPHLLDSSILFDSDLYETYKNTTPLQDLNNTGIYTDPGLLESYLNPVFDLTLVEDPKLHEVDEFNITSDANMILYEKGAWIYGDFPTELVRTEIDKRGIKVNEGIFSKPLYLRRFKVKPKQGLIEELNAKVDTILQGCCVDVDRNFMTAQFRDSAVGQDVMPRLFGGSSDSVKLPLLFLNLYCRDGFIHPNTERYRLDPHSQQYTSSDLRELVTGIVTQIYIGSQIDNERILKEQNYGYYIEFRKRMMLEKGYNLDECKQKLKDMYSNRVVTITQDSGKLVYQVTTNIFNKLSPSEVKMKGQSIIGGNILHHVWNKYGYDYNLGYSSDSFQGIYAFPGYSEYNMDAEAVMILAKLFKTELGESVDMHMLCCIEDEHNPFQNTGDEARNQAKLGELVAEMRDTTKPSVSYAKKVGYWECEDNDEWGEPTTDEGIKRCRNYYNIDEDHKSSIQKCKESGHLGANDNCCICKMVQNIRDEEVSDDDSDASGAEDKEVYNHMVGPVCQVRECQQTLDDMNELLKEQRADQQSVMTIDRRDWRKPCAWDEDRQEGPEEGLPRLPRLMSHNEISYSYNSVEGPDYGKITKNEKKRESYNIKVLCETEEGEKVPGKGSLQCNLFTGDELASYTGKVSCDGDLSDDSE